MPKLTRNGDFLKGAVVGTAYAILFSFHANAFWFHLNKVTAFAFPLLIPFCAVIYGEWITLFVRIYSQFRGWKRYFAQFLLSFLTLSLSIALLTGFVPLQLAHFHKSTTGEIIEVTPKDHYTYKYTFSAERGTYQGYGACHVACDKSLLGTKVIVSYLIYAPEVSQVGELFVSPTSILLDAIPMVLILSLGCLMLLDQVFPQAATRGGL